MYLLERLLELREHFLMFTKGLGGFWVQEILSLWSWGTSPSWHLDVFTKLKTLQTPCYWDFMEAITHNINRLLISFPTPLPSLENGWWRPENMKLLIMALSFWWPSPIQEPTQSCLIRTKYTSTTLFFFFYLFIFGCVGSSFLCEGFL